MRIQHNITALNSHRNLTMNSSAVGKNLEKLSSGYRINRAGDDAAGLAISEKMRSQITGLETAQKNAQDGISLVQTAEGALTEVHSMLNRMVELSTQSANGTYTDSDRQKLNDEIEQLKEEINRISEATNFNGINLLDGSLGTSAVGVADIQIPENAATGTLGNLVDAVKGVYTTAAQADDAGMVTGDTTSLTVNYTTADGKSESLTIDLTYKSATELIDKDGNVYTVTGGAAEAAEKDAAFLTALKNSDLGKDFDITSGGDSVFTFTAKEAGTNSIVIDSTQASTIKAGVAANVAPANITVTAAAVDAYQELDLTKLNATDNVLDKFSINGQEFQLISSDAERATLDKDVIGLIAVAADGTATAAEVTGWINTIKQATGLDIRDNATPDGSIRIYGSAQDLSGGLELQVGDTADDFQKVTVQVGDMSASSLGLKNLDISTAFGAEKAIESINEAIELVSTTRSAMGAIQNRLEHTINNLGVTTENMTAAESRIRDVDMAKEMMEYTKNNILVQSSQAMLAQANQIPQGVLQLLQ